MKIKEAFDIYFRKLNEIYTKTFNSSPSASWSPDINQDLFVSAPDEDGEARWKPILGHPLCLPELCDELNQFYGSYYFCVLNGLYDHVQYYFEPIDSLQTAKKKAKQAVLDGEYYFKNQKAVLLASCSKAGNDDLLLFYNQETNSLFLYDRDKRFIFPLEFTLVQLISQMEALI